MYGCEPAAQDDDFLYAVDLFNAGFWWEAHVYWERLWAGASVTQEREFLRGLIQLSAALVKHRQGSETGRDKLFAKAMEKLRRIPSADFMGVRVSKLVGAVEAGGIIEIELRA